MILEFLNSHLWRRASAEHSNKNGRTCSKEAYAVPHFARYTVTELSKNEQAIKRIEIEAVVENYFRRFSIKSVINFSQF